MRGIVAILVLLLAGAGCGAAHAQADLFSRDTFNGLVDLRLGASDGARSWLKGGFGPTRFSGAGDGFAVRPQVQGDLIWTPQLFWGLSGVVDVLAQPGQHHGADIGEAYLLYKPLPVGGVHYQVRAGLMYPPVSLEHAGYGGEPWVPRDTITPSAINSWIGEEVHTAGIEASAHRAFAGHDLGATLAVFQANDTSGTLLSIRGWGLNDYQETWMSRLPLPPLNPFLKFRQAKVTEPVRELDDRVGAYARLDWKLPSRLAVNLFYYDNRGDRVAVDKLQWAWATRFWNLGATYDVDARTQLIAQALTGKTLMGFPVGRSVWVDADFSSAYLLATRRMLGGAVTGRVETFRVQDNNRLAVSDYDEHGWAATFAYRRPLSRRVTLLVEALHVASTKPERSLAGEAAKQDQTTLQASLRLGF